MLPHVEDAENAIRCAVITAADGCKPAGLPVGRRPGIFCRLDIIGYHDGLGGRIVCHAGLRYVCGELGGTAGSLWIRPPETAAHTGRR